MPIPESLLPHTVTLVRPAQSADAYNNVTYSYGAGATRTEISAWLQQDQRTETFPDGRAPLDQRWPLITNHDDVRAKDRIEWADHPQGAVTFDIDGPPEPAYTPAGFHHTEATLRLVDG